MTEIKETGLVEIFLYQYPTASPSDHHHNCWPQKPYTRYWLIVTEIKETGLIEIFLYQYPNASPSDHHQCYTKNPPPLSLSE